MSACLKDDVFAEGHGSPFGPEEWCLMGNRAGAHALLFMQSELAGDATHPLVVVLEALSSLATVAVNSCCISKHKA